MHKLYSAPGMCPVCDNSCVGVETFDDDVKAYCFLCDVNWDLDFISELKASDTSPSLEKWNKMVVDRNNRRCTICDGEDDVQAWHIVPPKDAMKFACDPANGLALCRNCRKYAERGAGR